MFELKKLRPPFAIRKMAKYCFGSFTKKFLLFAFVLAVMFQTAYSQDYSKDTVWTRKTDQSQGFNMVKFSNNDSLIVGQGLEMDLFFDAKTGQEIKRIPGNNEVVFFNNDKNFLRENEPRTRYEIFNMSNYEVVDTLENDSLPGTGSIKISKNESFIIATIKGGIRVWDLKSRKIIKTKLFPKEPNLIYAESNDVMFTCDMDKILCHLVKTYEDPQHPGDSKYYKTWGGYILYNINTLDSLDCYTNARGLFISPSCKYFAIVTGDPDYGVEIYDFNTKQLLHKLSINGPSLTGIEFSPDDNYLITSGAGSMRIWNLDTGTIYYSYPGGEYSNFSISHSGKYIISSTGRILFLWDAKFSGTGIKEKDNKKEAVYPNPSSGMAVIQFEQKFPEITNIQLLNVNGKIVKEIFHSFLEQGQQRIEFDTKDIPDGLYLVLVRNTHLSLTFKLIVSK